MLFRMHKLFIRDKFIRPLIKYTLKKLPYVASKRSTDFMATKIRPILHRN